MNDTNSRAYPDTNLYIYLALLAHTVSAVRIAVYHPTADGIHSRYATQEHIELIVSRLTLGNIVSMTIGSMCSEEREEVIR